MKAWLARAIALVFVGSFCIVGPLLVLLALAFALQRLTLIYAGEHVEGTVIAKRPTGSARVSYAPVFEFTAGDGRRYTVISDVYGAESAFQFGERVPVVYPHRHPESARIDRFAQLWTFPLVAGTVGAGFSVIPALIWVSRRRQRLASEAALTGQAPAGSVAPDQVSAGFRWALGLLLIGTGITAIAAALGGAWATPDAGNASPVPLSAIGVLLLSCGVLMGQWVRTGGRFAEALGAAAITAMSTLFGWVALYGDPAGFSIGVGVGGAAASSSGSAGLARIAFGTVAVVFGLASLWTWVRVFRVRRRPESG